MKRIILICMVISLLFSIAVPCFAEGDNLTIHENAWETIYHTNVQRLEGGLVPLTTYEGLNNVAIIRANEICEVFSHTRPNGMSCFSALDDQKISYYTAGENIAAGYQSASAVVKGWMSSEGHRANIMESNFSHIGVGYKDLHWVQVFTDGAEYTSIDVGKVSDCTYFVGNTMEQIASTYSLGIYAVDKNGTQSFMPLMAELCTGYNPAIEGTQTVTVNVFNLTTKFDITLEDAGTVEGDANGDGVFNTSDAVTVLRYCASMIQLSGNAKLAADYNKNGTVNTADASAMLRSLVK